MIAFLERVPNAIVNAESEFSGRSRRGMAKIKKRLDQAYLNSKYEDEVDGLSKKDLADRIWGVSPSHR